MGLKLVLFNEKYNYEEKGVRNASERAIFTKFEVWKNS